MITDFFEMLTTGFDRFCDAGYKVTDESYLEIIRFYFVSCRVVGVQPKDFSSCLTPAEIIDLNKIVDQDMKTLFQEYQVHFGQKTQEDMKSFFENMLNRFLSQGSFRNVSLL